MESPDPNPELPDRAAPSPEEERENGVPAGRLKRSLEYFTVGLALSLLCGFARLEWSEIGEWIFDAPYWIYDRRHAWFEPSGNAIAVLPIVVGFFVLLARLRRGKSVRFLAFATGGCLPPLALLALVMLPFVREYLGREEFDSAQWTDLERVERMDPFRLRMVDDLLDRYELKGMTAEEIRRLLGPGDEDPGYWDSDFVYWLGPERAFVSIDNEWLLIDLGDDGRVASYAVVSD